MPSKVLYIGQLTDMSGYGNAARNYVKCFDMFLESDKVEFAIFNQSYEREDSTSEEEKALFQKYSIQNVEDFCDEDTVVIVHQVPMYFLSNRWQSIAHNFKKENVISSMAWEPDRLPSSWVEIYKQHVGRFIVYCEFTRQCFLSHGFKEENVHLLEHPIFCLLYTSPSPRDRG